MPTPPNTEIHLHFADLRQITPYDDSTVLSADEKQRAERFATIELRRRFVASRIWMRRLLGACLGEAPETLSFIANEHGKPRLADQDESAGLTFNLSHSEDFALLAVARAVPIGCDLELPKTRRNLAGLADYCLSDTEREQWDRLTETAQADDFFRRWVAKEAFVKAVGRGIALGLKRIELSPVAEAYTALPTEFGPAANWCLATGRIGDCRYAVAYRGPARVLRTFEPEAFVP